MKSTEAQTFGALRMRGIATRTRRNHLIDKSTDIWRPIYFPVTIVIVMNSIWPSVITPWALGWPHMGRICFLHTEQPLPLVTGGLLKQKCHE